MKEKPAPFMAGKRQSEDTTKDWVKPLKLCSLWPPASSWTVSPKPPPSMNRHDFLSTTVTMFEGWDQNMAGMSFQPRTYVPKGTNGLVLRWASGTAEKGMEAGPSPGILQSLLQPSGHTGSDSSVGNLA